MPRRANLDELAALYAEANVRRWGIWIDGQASLVAQALAQSQMVMTTASPGMGASLEDLETHADATVGADLGTVGRVNDLAYGNFDGRLERTLTPLPNGVLKGYRADLNGSPAAVALALHHGRRRRDQLRRDGPECAAAGARDERDAAGAERRSAQRLHDHHASGHRHGRAVVREPRVPAPDRHGAVGAADVTRTDPGASTLGVGRDRLRFEPSGRRPFHGTSWRSGATVAPCATIWTERRSTAASSS